MNNYEKFIEVHVDGRPWLVNLDHVEQIMQDGEKTCIYFAYTPQADEGQDWMRVDEKYEQIRDRIWG